MTSAFSLVIESTPLFLTGVFFFGLLIGSFLNVVILRLPARLEHEWSRQCREILELEDTDHEPPESLVSSRSRCTACGHLIRPFENIPVISFIALKGRCSSCKVRISIRYPIVELATAVLFLIVAIIFGPTLSCLAALVFTGFLIALAGIDLDHQLLPDNLTLPLLWLGLLFSLSESFTTPVDSIIGGAVGYLFLWSVFQGFKLLTGKEGMGYGDFKLMAAVGTWLGWQMLPIVILLSSFVGAVIGGAFLAISKKSNQQPIPFGPFIAISGWLAMVWGKQALNAYWSYFGLV